MNSDVTALNIKPETPQVFLFLVNYQGRWKQLKTGWASTKLAEKVGCVINLIHRDPKGGRALGNCPPSSYGPDH